MRLMLTNGKEKLSYKTGFYKKLGWTERPSVANFVYYYRSPGRRQRRTCARI